MSALVITEVANPYNGVSVDLQFDRAPTGGLSILVSRAPEDYGSPARAVVDLGSHRYRVHHPFREVKDRAPELMYFTACEGGSVYSTYRDDNGYLQGQAAAWVGTSREDELTDIMKRLWQRVADNRAGIEARLQMIEPATTVKQMIWGMGERIETYPAIEINQVSLSEPYMGSDRFRLGSVRADIYGYIVHQTPTVEAELVTAFGRATQRILNQQAYEEMACDCGRILVRCQAQELSFDNNIWNGQRWVSSFSLVWTGEFGEVID